MSAPKSISRHLNNVQLVDSAQNGSIFSHGVSNSQQKEGTDCDIVVQLYKLLLRKGLKRKRCHVGISAEIFGEMTCSSADLVEKEDVS